jgi:hypothetical protein
MKVSSPLSVGAKVFIRTVTHYYTGEVVALSHEEIVLRHAAWIADTGRFATALASGDLNEVEPYPGEGIVSINRMAVIDASPWTHAFPRETK